MIDNDLKNFCLEVLWIVESGMQSRWFNHGFALCTNAGRYDQYHNTFVYETLKQIFDGETYPFNEGDSARYRYERWHGGFYKNEERLAFLKKYANRA